MWQKICVSYYNKCSFFKVSIGSLFFHIPSRMDCCKFCGVLGIWEFCSEKQKPSKLDILNRQIRSSQDENCPDKLTSFFNHRYQYWSVETLVWGQESPLVNTKTNLELCQVSWVVTAWLTSQAGGRHLLGWPRVTACWMWRRLPEKAVKVNFQTEP